MIGTCEGCVGYEGSDWVKLVEHHWPQSISKVEARKLGQTRMLCYWCNKRLRDVFPKIDDVPWEVQFAELQSCAFVDCVG